MLPLTRTGHILLIGDPISITKEYSDVPSTFASREERSQTIIDLSANVGNTLDHPQFNTMPSAPNPDFNLPLKPLIVAQVSALNDDEVGLQEKQYEQFDLSLPDDTGRIIVPLTHQLSRAHRRLSFSVVCG
jgi:hypothetical protein